MADEYNGPSELHLKYRPKTLAEFHGQPEMVKMVKGWLKEKKVPHVTLMVGPSGVGKTSLARYLKGKLECSDADFYELNCADDRGIDTVRDIQQRIGMAPMAGKSRIWLLDEAARWTSAAQSSALKVFEDCPKHVYFMLATTDPEKLLPTIRTRCSTVVLKPLSDADLTVLLSKVALAEGIKLSEAAKERIIETAEGGARLALNLLNKIMGLESEEDQLEIIYNSDTKKQAIDLARTLIDKSKKWADVAKIIKNLEGEPESIRRMILGYTSAVLLNNGQPRAFIILDEFERNWFDSGKAGLIRACYSVYHSK